MTEKVLHVAMVWTDGTAISEENLAVLQIKVAQLVSTVELIVRTPVDAESTYVECV